MSNLTRHWRMLLAAPLLMPFGNVTHAAISGNATPLLPPVVVVGDTGVAGRLVLAPSNVTDDFPVTVTPTSISTTLSCAATGAWNCAGGDIELGVFSIEDTTQVPGGPAAANEVCADTDFNFSAPDGTGQIDVTIDPGSTTTSIVFNSTADFCTINFTLSVDMAPAQDAVPAVTGIQTRQGGEAEFIGNSGEDALATGSDTTTVSECSVRVDKQVSCDGGSTWTDVGYDDDTTDHCSALDDDPIQVRYLANNPEDNCALTNCTWTESNNVFGQPADPFDLDNGDTNGPVTRPEQMCSTAFGDPGNPNEPNMISISCDTEYGGTVGDDDTASFSCLSVDLLVDRNVTCTDGSPIGAVDEQLVSMDDDGPNGCTTLDGNAVTFGYQSCNNGTAPLYGCRLVDDNSAFLGGPVFVGDLAPEGCAAPEIDVPVNNSNVCSTALETAEGNDGLVTLECCLSDVDNMTQCNSGDRVAVYDESRVTCQTQSTLEIVKQCVDNNPEDGTDDGTSVVVTASSGDVGFTNCTVTDTIYLENDDCSEPLGTGTSVSLSNDMYDLDPLGEETSTGGFGAPLEADACNTASVTCTNFSGGQVTEDATPVVCSVMGEGCITRTGGYWATHPDAAAAFLDIEVCGETIGSVQDEELSTSETLCSVGKDGKILGDQVTQLIRQCTAAALNLAVSESEEGSCEQQDQNDFAACCGAAIGEGNYCSAEDDGAQYSVSECIGLMDDFNNSLDTLQSDVFQQFGSADPGLCQASKNNGYHPYDPGYEAPAKPGKGPKK